MGWKPITITCKRCGTEFIGVPTRTYCSRACSARISRNKRHGHASSETSEYGSWIHMRERCRNPKAHNYARYGGRGITICERWDVFENFLEDMGPKPGKGYSIERRDNNGNYEPSNCKWATQAEQNKNKSNAWTPAQDQQILDCAARGLNFKQMSRVIGKSASSITMRAYRIGASSGQPVKKITDRPNFSFPNRSSPNSGE